MDKLPSEIIKEFLLESNAIEGVYDMDSLTQAMEAWEYIIKQDEINLDNIKRTHKILMVNQPLKPSEKGFFRTVPVYVGGREGIKHEKIEKALVGWCAVMNYKSILFDFFESFSKDYHVQYERIHPFVDGNGRTGRIFMNWWRVRNGLPILVIHEGEEQMDYYKWFKEKKNG